MRQAYDTAKVLFFRTWFALLLLVSGVTSSLLHVSTVMTGVCLSSVVLDLVAASVVTHKGLVEDVVYSIAKSRQMKKNLFK